ncbi:hypothetical protein A2U01_0064253 [Trifolium medium]|uniref:Uncharacterized protein n=1 Tax=Trifolium medium TaxID=97028 RepID=A0A392S562_9FABA|nr:hypothetical protein [Trifolium medium]
MVDYHHQCCFGTAITTPQEVLVYLSTTLSCIIAAIQCSNTPLISDNISHVLMKFNPTVMLQPAYYLTRNTVRCSTSRLANGCDSGSKRVFF